MHSVFEAIAFVGVMPIIVLEHARDAVPVAEALVAGGLPLVEVTLRTDAALEAVAAMATVPGLLVGAGTVMTTAQVDQVIDAGAAFAMAPHFNIRTVEHARTRGLPYVPGVLTPTEMNVACEAGCVVQKVFPAETAGGAAFLKAVSAPLPGIRFLPTGSIDVAKMPAYLRVPSVLAIGGNWMVAPSLIADGNWSEITRLAAEAVAVVRSVRAQTTVRS